MPGFDWYVSGLTTATCGATKGEITDLEHELGFFICGGKGGASRKTPDQTRPNAGKHLVQVDAEKLVFASKMYAKVDSAAMQDGYNLYHYAFFFDRTENWTVVQQRMNDTNGWARRYYWLSTWSISLYIC